MNQCPQGENKRYIADPTLNLLLNLECLLLPEKNATNQS